MPKHYAKVVWEGDFSFRKCSSAEELIGAAHNGYSKGMIFGKCTAAGFGQL